MWAHQNVPLPWKLDPIEAMRRWPVDRPLLMLHSGRFDPRWSRLTVLAEPDAAYVHHRGRSDWVGWSPPTLDWSHDPIADLGLALEAELPLFIGYIAYDVARHLERLPALAEADRHWPLVQFHRCPGWLVYDGQRGEWSAHGAWASAMQNLMPRLDRQPSRRGSFDAEEPQPLSPRESYEAAVRRGIEYIAAGDVFQVNLAQRFSAGFAGDPRALYASLAGASPAWYGAYLECLPTESAESATATAADANQPRRYVCSTSPELFLQLDAEGNVVTRPIKGTRPATAAPEELEHSGKDLAELNMIVDLLRNDLGRVCEFGSVRVDQPRVVESHPTVHHGVATITGRLARGRSMVDLLRATLPGGSITGAPKVRAMQIIEELEPVRRGPYCGCIGWAHGGAAAMSIAIRTMLVELGRDRRGWVDFSVGAGVVGDSRPDAEYDETLTKAAAMLAALRKK
jgi:para-aminobenzoate synthetase component 1